MDSFRKSGLALLAVSVVAVAGCNSSRLSSLNSEPAPAPLTAAPSGTVAGQPLPPPTSPTAGVTDPSAFPPPPGTDPNAPPGTSPTATAAVTPPATAPDLTAGSVAGVWTAQVSGQSCKVATPQTKFGAGYRAGPLRCPAPLDGIKSWNVAGKQLTLYDESGAALARLYSSSAERFDGQTESGIPVSLTR